MNKKIAAVAVAVAAVVLLTASSCDDTPDSAQTTGQALTEQAFTQQSAAVPYPADQLRDSLERKNLKERLLRTNKPDAQGYVYLMSFGQIIGYYTVQGKVSSTQSQMTTDNLVIDRYEGDVVVNAPGDDGSYGANEPGIFFFTTEGQMITTNLDYIWSDNLISIDTPRLG
jgi:hypothetical protein